MGGDNCCIVGCSASRSRHKGLSFFRLPNVQKHPEWRSRMLQIIRSTRDDVLNLEKLTVCSRHFTPESLRPITADSNKRKRFELKVGSTPTLFLPEKSIPSKRVVPRKPPVVRDLPCTSASLQPSFSDISTNIQVPSGWIYECNENNLKLYKFDNGRSLKVDVDSDLVCELFYNDYRFPDSSIIDSDLYSFLCNFENSDFCLGIPDKNLQRYSDIDQTQHKNHFLHVKLKMDSPHKIDYHTTIRSKTCHGFANLSNVKDTGICKNCYNVRTNLRRKLKRDVCTPEAKIISSKTALQRVSKGVLTKALKESRKKIKMLNKQVDRVKTRIRKESVLVKNTTLHDSLVEIIENEDLSDPLIKLFWEQQKLAFSKGSGGHKWHPMLIRLAILLHSQSPASYRSLRDTGIIKLPGESTLRDYSNVIKPAPGFQNEVLSELKEVSNKLKDNQRWVVLLHDEMSVKSDLVFDRQNGNVVGFINTESYKNELKDNIASHCLVFMVIGINSNIKCSLGWFATKCATASDLYPVFWEAVGHLETFCNLKVIGATCDKASSNMRFLNLHGEDAYKTTNVYDTTRSIYFFSDVPHLLKTVRNNLSASGSNQNTRYLWKNGRNILWQHVIDVYEKDMSNELSRCTKLSYNHIYLTSYSVMKVKYAVQVLSKSVGKIMETYGGEDVLETSKLILLMDRFFDCLNGRSFNEADCKRKPDLLPYKDINDSRFTFLTEEFLGYLEEWKKEVDKRPGFSRSEKSKMFLSHQTYKGLVMTAKSFVEATKFLLDNGVSFVLSNKFCQDPLEEHFGRHRAIGRRSDNPTLYQFGYQENKLRLQRSLALQIRPKGNVLNKRKEPIQVDATPLKKRRKH